MFGFSFEQILGFTVIGSIVTTIGSLLATFIKEYFLTRSFENWKIKNTLRAVSQKYRDPILLSAKELCYRIHEICENYPSIFLNSKLLKIKKLTQVKNAEVDQYYKKYKLISTLYRLCAFLGWLELYRQDITYLNHEQSNITRIDKCLNNIRADLADGPLNEASDWDTWRDGLIYREEQRAIGDVMIYSTGQNRTIVGYGKFCEMFFNENKNYNFKWLQRASTFLLDLKDGEKDFRKIRLIRLIVHLADLMESIQSKKVSASLRKKRSYWQSQLNEFNSKVKLLNDSNR